MATVGNALTRGQTIRVLEYLDDARRAYVREVGRVARMKWSTDATKQIMIQESVVKRQDVEDLYDEIAKTHDLPLCYRS